MNIEMFDMFALLVCSLGLVVGFLLWLLWELCLWVEEQVRAMGWVWGLGKRSQGDDSPCEEREEREEGPCSQGGPGGAPGGLPVDDPPEARPSYPWCWGCLDLVSPAREYSAELVDVTLPCACCDGPTFVRVHWEVAP